MAAWKTAHTVANQNTSVSVQPFFCCSVLTTEPQPYS